MENGKRVNVILIILLVVLLCVACGFGYMWYKTKNVSCPKCEDASASKDDSGEVVNKKIEVVDAANTISEYFGTDSGNKIKIVIPKIVGGGDNAEKLNKNMLDDVISKIILPIEDCDTSENPKGCENGYVADINVKYKSLIKNDIVNILIIVQLNPWNASGDGTFEYNYFYDIKNDKIITATESLDKNGYTDEKYLNEFTKCHGEDYEEVKCTLEHIKNTINEKNNCTYIDINNENLKVHFDDFCS